MGSNPACYKRAKAEKEVHCGHSLTRALVKEWSSVNKLRLALPAAAVTTFSDKNQTTSSIRQPEIQGVMRETLCSTLRPHLRLSQGGWIRAR